MLELDQAIFQWINTGWDSAILDAVLVPIRSKYIYIPLYIFIIAFSLINFRRAGYYFVVFLILTVGVADLVSNYGFKHTIERPRPCHVLRGADIDVRVRCGSGYSFTSNHAANHFGMSVFMFLVLGRLGVGRWRWALLLWAATIALAQVYVGVHYPSDVLAGALLGTLVAWLMFLLYQRSSLSPDVLRGEL